MGKMKAVVKVQAMAEVAILLILFAIAPMTSPAASAVGVATNIHGYGFYEDGSVAYFDSVRIINTNTSEEWDQTTTPKVKLMGRGKKYLLTLDDPDDISSGNILKYVVTNGTRTNTSYVTYTKLDFVHNITLSQMQTHTHTPTISVNSSSTPSPSFSPSPVASPTPIPSPTISPSPTVPPVQTATPSPSSLSTPTSEQRTPGFEAVFTIIMLVMSPLILKRKRYFKNE
jgi:hypothetical protein